MLAAAVGVVYRRPIGAVVTAQRVRRRLQMSRLDSTRQSFCHPATVRALDSALMLDPTSQLRQLSLASLEGRLIDYQLRLG